VAAVPFLNSDGRALYQRFLTDPLPRAFALAPTGSASKSSSGYDPPGYALRTCSRAASQCQLYAVNNDVVWTGPRPNEPGANPTRVVARTVPMNVSTSLGAFFAVNPVCSSRGLPKVSIAQLPAHGAAVVAPRDAHPAFPPNHPYVACNAALVPGVGVIYTPVHGYAGTDAVTIEEINLDGKRQLVRIELQVM
jgi:hypothetical protein